MTRRSLAFDLLIGAAAFAILALLPTVARPLRSHETDQRDRDDTLPAEFAPDLHRSGENAGVEQP